MKILARYIIKQVVIMVMVVALALTGLDFFFNLVQELKVVGKANYTLGHALVYLILVLPSRFYLMFPWAALIGGLISLGNLAKHGELVIMRCAGLSAMDVAFEVLKAAVMMLLVVCAIGEWVAPSANRLAYSKRAYYLGSGQSIETNYGLWIKQNNTFTHIQSIQADGELRGITQYQFNENNELKEAVFAKRAVQTENQWEFYEVEGTQFLGTQTQSFQLEVQPVAMSIDQDILENSFAKYPERLSLVTLIKIIKNCSENALNAQPYTLALWIKLIQPFVILMMLFLAVPFVFGPLRGKSVGSKIVIGVLVAFTFHTLNRMFVPLAIVYDFPPFLAVMTPVIGFAAMGVYMMRKV